VLDNLARILWAADRREESIQALEEARALDPSDITIRFSLAAALDMNSQADRAGELFESLLHEDAVTTGMLTHIGGRYLRLRQPDRAEPLLRRILAKQPETDTTTLLLSELRRQKKDTAGAMRLIDDVMARSPGSIPAHERKLLLLMESGEYTEARRVLAQALLLDPDNRTFVAVKERLGTQDR
jgi:predicted Zn-dependent protease